MSRTEWGLKRRCASCEAMFYDMLRHPISCPKCGATFRADAPPPRRSSKPAPKARAPRARKEAPLPTVDSGPVEVAGRATDVVEEIDDPEVDSEIDDDDDDDDDDDAIAEVDEDDEDSASEIGPGDAARKGDDH